MMQMMMWHELGSWTAHATGRQAVSYSGYAVMCHVQLWSTYKLSNSSGLSDECADAAAAAVEI